MLVIRVDDEVYSELQAKAAKLGIPFTTPNHILRIILKLDTSDYTKPRNK